MDKTSENSHSHKKQCCDRCLHILKTPSFFLLCNFLLSQWGDWMWQFAAGLYLVHLSDGKLRLAAIFGFLGGGCVLLFGGIIGDWVDKNGRLKVVRISLFIQNFSVMASAIFVCILLGFQNSHIMPETYGRYAMEATIVGFAIIAQLSSVAYKIAIEKDWIVEIAEGKSSFLSNLNAITRSLDLMCKIVSPLTVGLIMSYASLFVSAIVIAVWNLVSVFIEYALLLHIYSLVPKLADKTIDTESHEDDEKEREMLQLKENGMDNVKDDSIKKVKPSFVRRIFHPVLTLVEGWQTYAKQEILFAGISLACLYMTVLGFDSITLGYIYMNGITEFVVGICMGLAGLMGIIGAFLFTRFAKFFGLNRTGIIAFYSEIACLVLAVVSVWMTGSPFDISVLSKMENSSFSLLEKMSSDFTEINNTTDLPLKYLDIPSKFNTSIILLLIGIIASRVGLWMADLVVTQVMQESIVERERGIVNGVQNSLNMFMDMLKFLLVIMLPQIEVFGIHIILSFLFICAGGICFTNFYCKHYKSSVNAEDKIVELKVDEDYKNEINDINGKKDDDNV